MSREHTPEAEHEAADRAAPAPTNADPAQQASFHCQALADLGIQRQPRGAPSFRDQALGEIGALTRDALVQRTAAEGVAGSGGALPHAERIQHAFGDHDLSDVTAHVGGDAATAADALGARAYATGDQLAFAESPDLHTAAHEAAHAVQQRAGLVAPGLGPADEVHERHADRVADAVVAGDSAAPLLDQAAGPATASGGPTVQRKPAAVQLDRGGRAAPLDDWDPRGPVENRNRRPKPAEFRGVGLTESSATVFLGSIHHQHYWIGNHELAPKGTSYQWQHSVRGTVATGDEILYGDTGTGERHDLAIQPRIPGQKQIKTQLVQQGPGAKQSLDVDDVQLTTPVPVVRGAPVLESVSKEGNRRPVLDTFAMGEDLLVTVQFSQLGDDADEARATVDGGDLTYQSARKLAPGEFEIRLHPSRPGKVTGNLRVLPLETLALDMPPIKLELQVETLKSQDDAGSRPPGVDGIGRWMFPAIAGLFERRKDGIYHVYEESKEKDPPPSTPLWKTILKAAVTVAINAVTAGLGAKIANAIVANADSRHFTTEMVKVLFEQSMSPPAVAAAEAAIDRNDSGDSRDNRLHAKKPQKGPQRSLGITFHDAQSKALTAEKLEKEQRDLTTIETMVKRKEAEQPGSGFREALKLDAAIKQHIATAEPEQYLDSFQAWCSVLASNTLNDEHDGPTTNLAKTTDVNRFLRDDDGWSRSPDGDPGFARTPGVLNLELAEDAQRTFGQGDRQTHPLKVKRATIAGLDSEAFRKTISDVPLRDLKMPIVAAFQEFQSRPLYSRAIGGFAIGRNEAHQYWASEQGEYLSVLTAIRMGKGGKVDVREAARYILEQEIGSTTVEPEEP